MSLPNAARLSSLSSEVLLALAHRLRELDFVAQLAPFGAIGVRSVERLRAPIRRWHLRRHARPVVFAMRMFCFNDPVTEAEARLALGEVPLEPLIAADLVRRDAKGELASPYALVVANELFLLTDVLSHGGDAVMGLGETTGALAVAAHPSEKLGRVLDVGCGAGTIGLLYAAHAEHVVGTDINPRAIAIAALNARLNGIGNIEFRAGDGFAAVKGERFDRIVSQPPFVAQPPGDADATTFLFGGARGDEVALAFLREVPGHLAPQGRAVFLVEWPVVKDDPIEGRVRAAIDSSDVSVVVLASPTDPALASKRLDDFSTQYAAMLHPSLGPEFDLAVARWRTHFELLHIETLRYTFIVVWPAPPARGTISTVPFRASAVVDAATIDALVAARELLGKGSRAIVAAKLRVADGVRFTEEAAEASGESKSSESKIVARFPSGALHDSIVVNGQTAELVTAIHEAESVREVAKAMAAKANLPVDDLLEKIGPAVEQLILRGLLVVA